jgi:hypothetical protein
MSECNLESVVINEFVDIVSMKCVERIMECKILGHIFSSMHTYQMSATNNRVEMDDSHNWAIAITFWRHYPHASVLVWRIAGA